VRFNREADRRRIRFAQHVCERGALGSPYTLATLGRAIRRLRREPGGDDELNDLGFLVDIGKLLFSSRDPVKDYVSSQDLDPGCVAGLIPEPFLLCGRAIRLSVFRHDWNSAGTLFDDALQSLDRRSAPILRDAVNGLKERFVLLPSIGSGVRAKASATDTLWQLNLAEQLFCEGRVFSAQKTAESLLTRDPYFGWARILLVRILFAQEDFIRARSVLSASPVGTLCVAEELAWDTLLSGMILGWEVSAAQTSRLRQQFRLPGYFDGLNWLLRGEAEKGMNLLQGSFRAGDPFSLMMLHDPVVKFAIGRLSKTASIPVGQGASRPSFLSADA